MFGRSGQPFVKGDVVKVLFNASRAVRAMAVCAMIAGGMSGAQAADKVVMKLGHTLAPNNHYQLMALKFSQEVAKRTNGKFDIQVFPQSQLGGEVQMGQALRTGTQELMLSAQAPIDNVIKQWQIFDLPYLFDSVDQANGVLQGPVGQRFLDMMPKVGMVGLGWISVGERDVFTAKKPINSLADMKDLKVRVMQSPGYIAGYKALGANPTPLPYSQVFLALSQGLVDGADTSPEQFTQDKFSDVSKHFYITHVNYLPVVLAISKVTWNRLAPDEQKAFKESAAVAIQWDLGEYKREYAAALEDMKKAGTQVTFTDTATWAAATESARADLVATIPDGKELYDAVQAAKKTVPASK
jgi:tripartite ATP-independent transporter DctP family solute receptor